MKPRETREKHILSADERLFEALRKADGELLHAQPRPNPKDLRSRQEAFHRSAPYIWYKKHKNWLLAMLLLAAAGILYWAF